MKITAFWLKNLHVSQLNNGVHYVNFRENIILNTVLNLKYQCKSKQK